MTYGAAKIHAFQCRARKKAIFHQSIIVMLRGGAPFHMGHPKKHLLLLHTQKCYTNEISGHFFPLYSFSESRTTIYQSNSSIKTTRNIICMISGLCWLLYTLKNYVAKNNFRFGLGPRFGLRYTASINPTYWDGLMTTILSATYHHICRTAIWYLVRYW